MSRATPPPSARPRGPSVAYLSIATATMVMVAAVALNASQPPPPTVAEFAPNANEQIKEPPPNQPEGPGTSGPQNPDAPTPTPTPTGGDNGGPKEVPRYLRCYLDAQGVARQTEDPQSPPCAAYWDPKKDNGGATWRGVTKDEIVIAWPVTIEKARDTENLAAYFNARFQFYGRKMRLEPYSPRGSIFDSRVEPAWMQADAEFVHETKQAFASLAYNPKAGAERYYYNRLAELGIVSVDSHATQRTEADYARYAPYQWGYLPAFDVLSRNFGEFICRSLAGRPPRYGGTGISDLNTPRKFGVVYHIASDGSSPDPSYIRNVLSGCNATPVATIPYNPGQQAMAEQAIFRLKDEEVTTVICLCQGDQYFSMMPAATNNLFFPEWLVSSYHYLDYDSAAQKYPAEHQEHVLGITFHNKWLPQKEMPWYQAIKEMDPTYETGDDGYASTAYERYYELLVLASGIQQAGPNLTPETFQRGLFRSKFPPPGSGRAPLWYPGGGFGPNDHTMVDDATMIWYSPSDAGYTTNVRRGTYCYIAKGKRYGLGQWPAGDPRFFEQPCK